MWQLPSRWRFNIFRTHVITSASTVRQEKRLPMTEGMGIEDLADLQIRQLVRHKSSLGGWERVSTDLYVFERFKDGNV